MRTFLSYADIPIYANEEYMLFLSAIEHFT
jgi:hypothetical protein